MCRTGVPCDASIHSQRDTNRSSPTQQILPDSWLRIQSKDMVVHCERVESPLCTLQSDKTDFPMDSSQHAVYANAHLVAKNLIEGKPGRNPAIHQAVADMIARNEEALMVSGLESERLNLSAMVFDYFFSGLCGQRH